MSRNRRSKAAGALLAAAISLAGGEFARAADAPDYTRSAAPFPKFWRGFEWRPIPRPDVANSADLSQLILNGKLELSLKLLNQLVVENSLDILSARFSVDIAQTDILRAKSGQAARGAPGAPLPNEIFASAIGAGVGAAGGGGGGGTGPAAISAAARQVVIGARGAFDPDVQVSFSYDHVTSPLNTLQVSGVPTVTTPSTAVLTRFEKAFATGFSFSVSYNSQRQNSTQQFLLYNPAYTSRLSISANQPLLAGFGLAAGHRFLDLAKNDLQISRERFRQQVTASLVTAQNAYWDLVAARENVQSAQRALDAATELYKNNRQQEAAGALAGLDVMQAQAGVASSRRDLVAAQSNVLAKELALKALITKNVDALDGVQLITTDPLPKPEESDAPLYREAVATALGRRSELTQAQIGLRNQEIAVRYTHNNLKPSLAVFGFWASSSLINSVGPMLQQVWWSVPYPEYAAGFSLTIPLRNRSAQADAIRAEIELSQQETTLARTKNQISLDVRTALTAVTQTRARSQSAAAAADYSLQALNAERVKLDVGVSTPYRVIQMQRAVVAAQALETQAQVDYAKARIQLDRTEGMTLERNQISVDDALTCCR